MNQLTLGIIGLGKIGLLYDLNKSENWIQNQCMTHSSAANKSELFRIVYLIDQDKEILKLAKRIFPNVNCLTLEEALTLGGPDFLIIATPTESHLEICQKVAAAWKPKRYLIEKPMGQDYEQSKKIKELIESSADFVFVNYFRRFLPHMRDLVESEAFNGRGKLLNVSISAYGTLRNIFSHFLDLINFLEGSEALNAGPKTVMLDTISTLGFQDNTNEIYFEFSNIDQATRNCEMRLVYEQLVIVICDNGRTIRVLGKDGTNLSSRSLTKRQFLFYQNEVMSIIGRKILGPKDTSGATDALSIHAFLESIDSEHV